VPSVVEEHWAQSTATFVFLFSIFRKFNPVTLSVSTVTTVCRVLRL
jgi:hypothetical protein